MKMNKSDDDEAVAGELSAEELRHIAGEGPGRAWERGFLSDFLPPAPQQVL